LIKKRIENEIMAKFISQLSNDIDSKGEKDKIQSKLNDYEDSISNSSDNLDPTNISKF
jgi:hypothetical protein